MSLIKTKHIILSVLLEQEVLKSLNILKIKGIHAVNVEGGMNEWGDEGTVIDSI